MKFNFTPGMIIFTLGFGGLVFLLVDSQGEIGSKIPLALFFMFFMGVGIWVQAHGNSKDEDMFGEMEGKGGFR